LPRWGYRKPIQTLDNWLLSIIRARRSAAPSGDLLGHLIAAGLDDAAIRDQMLTILIAGHDTTTALLAWTIYLLGSHPDVAAQLQAELEQSLHGEPPVAPSGWQPRLLDAVIKESLRLYPPIHLGNRRAASDLEIEGSPVHAGERLMYSIYLTQRDPQVWPQPDRFDPMRFIDGPKPPPYGYLPFGAGPRACMGAAYGMVEARLVLARLLQTFRFELIERRVRVHMGATLEPRPGVRMRVSPISPV
jgi:cytochrome P450